MSATYQINPAGVNTFDGTTLTSLTSFSINETGESATLGTDGKPYITMSITDNIMYTITVNGADQSIKPDIGSSGILVLVASLIDNGGSGVTATAITYTFANANLTDISSNINHAGVGDTSYTFTAFSSDGDTSPVVIS